MFSMSLCFIDYTVVKRSVVHGRGDLVQIGVKIGDSEINMDFSVLSLLMEEYSSNLSYKYTNHEKRELNRVLMNIK